MCSYELLSKVVSLLKEYRPQGLSLMDINREFYNKYGTRLNPCDYDSKSLYEMIENLSEFCDKAVVLVKHNTNQFKTDRIFIDDEAYERWIKTFKSNKNIKELEKLVIPILPEDVPLQHMDQNLIPHTSVPESAFSPFRVTSFKVNVIHVENPNLVFVRLSHNFPIYRKLVQMMRFYDGIEEQTDDYILPKELAVVGYLCAVRNPKDWDNWHRAFILDVKDEQIKLYAIDLGNIITEGRKELRLLKAPLFEIPPQIVRVSLTAIAPYIGAEVWSEESIEYLRQLVNKYKHNIHCIFLYLLNKNYFSVFLESSIDANIEDCPPRIPIYFHERLIQSGFADMISSDFNVLKGNYNNSDNIVSEAIEEPLLAIKYEPEFEEYQSPAVGPKALANETNHENKIKRETPVQPNNIPNNGPNEGLTPQQNGSTQNPKEINYKRLYFTADKLPDIQLLSYFKSDPKPFVEHKYFSEDLLAKEFPCFEYKYYNQKMEPKQVSALNLKYFNKEKEEKAFPPFTLKYFRQCLGEASTSSQTQNNQESHMSGDSVPLKYFFSDDWPAVAHKYFTSDDRPLKEHKYYKSENF